jgi:hypothetical protein
MTRTQANKTNQALLERQLRIPELVDLFGARIRRQKRNAMTFRYKLLSSRHLHIDLARGRIRQKGDVHFQRLPEERQLSKF